MPTTGEDVGQVVRVYVIYVSIAVLHTVGQL